MTHDELVDYIISELRHGTSEVEIRNALLAAGWQDADITHNFGEAHQKMLLTAAGHISEPTEKKRFLKNRTKAVIVMSIALLLLAAAAFGAYKYIPPSPEKVLKQVLTNVEDVHSMDFSGRLTADVDTSDNILNLQAMVDRFLPSSDERVAGASTSLQVALDFQGTIDHTDEENPRAEMNFNITSGIFTMGLKMRMIDETIYVRGENLPPLTAEFEKLANVWIKVDPKSLAKEYGVGLDLDGVQPTLTEGQKEQIQKLQEQAHFYNSITRLSDDMIGDTPTYHYAIVIDKAGLKNYLEEVNKVYKAAGGLDDNSLAAFDALQFKNLEIWIGKDDRLPYRTSMQISQAASADFMPIGSLNLLMNFSNYNNTHLIEPPTDFKKIEDVIKEFTTLKQ